MTRKTMKIAGTEYNINHKALEIYLYGCNPPHCEGCHNPGLWDFTKGYDAMGSIFNTLTKKADNRLVERVWFLGGEPQDQDPKHLAYFLGTFILAMRPHDLEIWVWTRYEELQEELVPFVDYAKFGEYREEIPPWTEPLFNIELASGNQRIVKI